MSFKTNYKKGQLVRLTWGDDVRPDVYQIYHVMENTQFAYSIRRYETKKDPGGTWQEYQLTPLTPEKDPEYFL